MIGTNSSRYAEQSDGFSKDERKIIPAIVCSICAAGYGPSPVYQNLMQAPPTLLEAAFMSMCHFCFRCRRPACPGCWDAMHGVCGACVQEAHLAFRVEVSPLNVVFPPSPVQQMHPTQETSASPPLVCIRSGRFQTDIALTTNTPKSVPVVPPKSQLVEESPMRSKRTTAQENLLFSEEKTKEKSAAPPQVLFGTPTSQVQNDDVTEKSGAVLRFFKVVERIVTVILLIILLTIAVMVLLAELSTTANTQIIRLFHIDIRHEIGYLVSLIQQLHW